MATPVFRAPSKRTNPERPPFSTASYFPCDDSFCFFSNLLLAPLWELPPQTNVGAAHPIPAAFLLVPLHITVALSFPWPCLSHLSLPFFNLYLPHPTCLVSQDVLFYIMTSWVLLQDNFRRLSLRDLIGNRIRSRLLDSQDTSLCDHTGQGIYSLPSSWS